MLVWSTVFSVIVQILTGGIDVYGLTINLPDSYKIYSELLKIELGVQIIELIFYIWLITQISQVGNITVYRYFDWFVTTPTMLFTLMVFLYHRPGMNITVSSFFKTHLKDILIVVTLNALMLIFGLLTEYKVLGVNAGVSLGFIPFACYFGYIYKRFIHQHSDDTSDDQILPVSRKSMFYYYLVFWSLYGLAAYLPYVQKNTAYNYLDLFAKNGFGLLIVYLIWYINRTCKHSPLPNCQMLPHETGENP